MKSETPTSDEIIIRTTVEEETLIDRKDGLAYSEDGRHKAFVDALLTATDEKGMNASKAGKLLGLKPRWGRYAAKDPQVRDLLAERAQSYANGAEEVLETLHAQMRFDIDDFLDDKGNFSLEKARNRKVTRLIKNVKVRTFTTTGPAGVAKGVEYDVQFYSSFDATALLTDIYGLRQKKQENESDVERKTAVYERMVDQVSISLEKRTGQPVDRQKVIAHIGAVDPAIYNFLQ